jgi:hypothetical protein
MKEKERAAGPAVETFIDLGSINEFPLFQMRTYVGM